MARVVNFASVTLDRVIEHMEAWHYNRSMMHWGG